MLRRVRETAPAGLVPLAWIFAITGHLDRVGDRAVLIAHVVMSVLLVAFVVLSWRDMRSGVLRAWRLVILAGIPVTLAGAAGAAADLGPIPLLVSVVGWALLPAPALWYTARESAGSARPVNAVAAALSLAGATAYLGAVVAGDPAVAVAVAGLAIVGVGQTVGIVDAVVRY
ncbi:hypothetical protein Hbl1158_11520 [Halobaculum sp. CBA1158]|uniref:hypothetical protein n=1 Tax=Halobaculum sp. CBA1158 TaxID=2904243 RepID=UPI001F2438DC|nr:hypothetical protein [Halobaculum sp. CBA1158]UIO99159.1 hypothetical protein Hbl1158_11520 [Halobaculum sp. CBA1158]